MKIQFKINYKTQWGQSLYLILRSEDNSIKKIGMKSNENFDWITEIQISTLNLSYQYALQSPDQSLIHEYGRIRTIPYSATYEKINISDNWRTPNGESPFLSTAFTNCFFKRKPRKNDNNKPSNSLIIRLNCPQIEPERYFAITGNQDLLGNWNLKRKVRLDESHLPVWSISLAPDKIVFPLEYKFLIVDTKTDQVLAWDEDPNHVIRYVDQKALTVVTNEHFIRAIPSWKAAGVAIPVFSLRSEKGFGIGEFLDLKKMVDWAKKTGQRIIQILPINDTILNHTDNDSYPYNAVSVNALHPIYLHLESMGKLKTKKSKDYFLSKKTELNGKTFSDYQNVLNAKWEYFKIIYQQDSIALFASCEYQSFFESNKEWLIPYAAFSFLRDLNGTPEFSKWKKYSLYNKQEIEALSEQEKSHFPEISFYYFLQYHLNKQLLEVHHYALKNGITIKGDIPIGISPRSVDAWVEPELFNTNVQAGAPPDDFSVTGQNWGFPTYNWESMEKEGYQWWRKRFKKIAEYFDAYRIDHILGFFRIWEIPIDAVWGLTGIFHPAMPLTRSELETKGLKWDENRFFKPYLQQHVINSTFGEYTDEVIRDYLSKDGVEHYKFKPEYDTQKKIEAHFASLGYLPGTKVLIRDGLYALHCEVLFICDTREPDKFHPRISIHRSATFRDLNDETKGIIDRIYVDYFYHRHTEFWKQHAMKKLPALISATNMLVCAEDLGMVPDSVPDVMNELEILSLEIQRMPKKPNMEFGMPADAPYRSVCTTSTHDMNPIRAWWEENQALTQRFYNRALGMGGAAPSKCEPWICEKIIEQHLYSEAMWIILPWQDWMGMDSTLRNENPLAERINVPSNPHNFWCYRMHMTLEKLLKEDHFNNKIKGMIGDSGRSLG